MRVAILTRRYMLYYVMIYNDYIKYGSRELSIPFGKKEYAEIAQRVLEVDPILKPESFQVEYTVDGGRKYLLCEFRSEDERSMRVGVNGVISSVLTILESIDELNDISA